jgi:hypothetical protein
MKGASVVTKHRCVVLGAIIAVAFISGCANYVITEDLAAPLEPQPRAVIGEFRDELPIDMDADKKPPLEDIDKLRSYIADELLKKEFFSAVSVSDPGGGQYEVTGAVIEYKKGSGVLRVLFGAFAGSGRLTTVVELRDKQTGTILFSGNFKGTVTHWADSGDSMFRQVAKDFAKSLRKESEKLAKGK